MVSSLDILLPFYGDVSLMKETVGSVRAQTDDDWRLLVVDDQQPDESVAGWFAHLDDPRIVYHRNHRNLGANANYRRALELATAELIVFLGADDRLLPNYVERAKQRIAQSSDRVALYQPGVEVIDDIGDASRPLGDRVKQWLRPRHAGARELAGPELVISLLHGNWTYFPSICWRRDVVSSMGFRREFDVVQDLALILDLALGGHAMLVDDEVTFQYRRHAASDSSVRSITGQRFTEERMLYDMVQSRCRQLGWDGAERAARARLTSRLHAVMLVPSALRARNTNAARRLLMHAVSD